MELASQIAVFNCPDSNASTLANDATGKFTVLSGRKSIIVVDLEANENLSSNKQTSVNTIVACDRENTNSIKKYPRTTKWDPTASQFNKQIIDLYALTCYRVVDIYSIHDFNPTKPKITLRGHSRTITDLEWSYFNPYLIGTSSADCLTNLWDIRDYRRPTSSLSSVSGGTHVKFSKTTPNLIATSHEIDIRIWDIRQPSLPLHYIAAHLQKINGMDWNPNRLDVEQELITCSQDSSLKLWDLSANKIKPTANFALNTPAWKVRYAPLTYSSFLTSTLPQLKTKEECSILSLWSLRTNKFGQKKSDLILSLIGHTDVVIDFDWRPKPTSSLDCELVTWSKDQTLRVWLIDHQTLEMGAESYDLEADCDTAELAEDFKRRSSSSPLSEIYHTKDVLSSSFELANKAIDSSKYNLDKESIEEDELALSTSLPQTFKAEFNFKDIERAPSEIEDDDKYFLPSQELKQEFSLINKNIPSIEFEEMDYIRRVCIVVANVKNIVCRLRIELPATYPQSDCPIFRIDSTSYGRESLSDDHKEKLLSSINETAKLQLARSRNCLEPCLRKFVLTLQSLTTVNQQRRVSLSVTGIELKDDPITISARRDHSVPFPRTSGARFCGNVLIVFGRPTYRISSGHSHSSTSKTEFDANSSSNFLVETPRSMAQLSAQLDNMRRQGSYNFSTISISYFYYGVLRRAELLNRTNIRNTTNSVSSSNASNPATFFSNRHSINKYVGGRSKVSSSHAPISRNLKSSCIAVHDVSNLVGGVSKHLAKRYVLDQDIIEMCKRNTETALEFNRRDLVQIWSLAQLSSEGVLQSSFPLGNEDLLLSRRYCNSGLDDRLWTMHPFGGKLIQSLIEHYVNNCHDVQTAAMLIWTFSAPVLIQKIKESQENTKNTENKGPSNKRLAIDPGNRFSKHMDMEYQLTDSTEKNDNLSMSQKDNFCDKKSEKVDPQEKFNILGEDKSLQNDLIMHIYSEILYRLGLLNQRAMLLKNIGAHSLYSEIFNNKAINPQQNKLENVRIVCRNKNCQNECTSAQCKVCKDYSLYCSICQLPVKGSSSVCTKCLHGGHISHFDTWFQAHDFCPTGCGCQCLEVTWNDRV